MTKLSFKPHAYQQTAYDFAMQNPYCAELLDMGLGKSVITLNVIHTLIYNLEITKPLIVAPKFVTRHTWPAELDKWEHLSGLTISVIAGTLTERLAALEANADIYCVSRDNIAWLSTHLRNNWHFDMVVLDESSNFKNQGSKRWQAISYRLPSIKRMMLLTGTPIPNGLMDLWAQIYLIDRSNPKRLFEFQNSFIMTYFDAVKRLGHGGMKYEIKKGAEEIIYSKINDLCLSMKAADYLDLPERQDIIRKVTLSDYSEYEQFKRDKILELPEGEITAFNAASLYTKLLQYANGAIYDADKNYHVVHDEKLDALEEVIEELQGANCIIVYQFKSDIERIRKRIKDTVILKGNKEIADWNAGKINKMLTHAASTAYGLNLQHGGHYIIWFGVPASLELFQQMVARLLRQGQLHMVRNIMILVSGTPEIKVYRALLDKTFRQDQLFEALK